MDNLIGILFILTVPLAWVLCFWLRRVVIRKTEQASFLARVPARSLLTTLCFGIGIIGGEGFALPGPILGALIFYNGLKFYPYTAIAPFIFFLALFFFLHAIGYFHDQKVRSKAD